MRGKALEQRRTTARELAKADGERRCAFCKRALPASGWVTKFEDARRFCNDDCMADDFEARSLRASE